MVTGINSLPTGICPSTAVFPEIWRIPSRLRYPYCSSSIGSDSASQGCRGTSPVRSPRTTHGANIPNLCNWSGGDPRFRTAPGAKPCADPVSLAAWRDRAAQQEGRGKRQRCHALVAFEHQWHASIKLVLFAPVQIMGAWFLQAPALSPSQVAGCRNSLGLTFGFQTDFYPLQVGVKPTSVIVRAGPFLEPHLPSQFLHARPFEAARSPAGGYQAWFLTG